MYCILTALSPFAYVLCVFCMQLEQNGVMKEITVSYIYKECYVGRLFILSHSNGLSTLATKLPKTATNCCRKRQQSRRFGQLCCRFRQLCC